MLSLLHSSFSLSSEIIYKVCFLLIKTRILALLPSLLHLHDLLKVALLILITYCLVDNLISAQVMHLIIKTLGLRCLAQNSTLPASYSLTRVLNQLKVLVNFLLIALVQEHQVIAILKHSSQTLAAQITCPLHMQSGF